MALRRFLHPVSTSSQRGRLVPLLIVAGALSFVYLATMAPGLSWANTGADGGDLITAAATGGVAHPTGYPGYLLLARLFQALPIGSLAYRTNLLSAVAAVVAAVLVYCAIWRALEAASSAARVWGACIGGLAFGLSPLVWSQAVITEVYALNLLFFGLLLYLLAAPSSNSTLRSGIIGLVQGLAIGNHMLSALMLPATLAGIAFRVDGEGAFTPGPSTRKTRQFNPPSVLNAFTGLVIGLLVYASLPLRAASSPPVNWGDPITPGRFLWLVSGNLYQDDFVQLAWPAIWANVRTAARLLVQAFGPAGLAAAALGLLASASPRRLLLLSCWVFVISTGFAVQYQASDSPVYVLPALLSVSVWLGLGVGHTVRVLEPRLPAARWLLGLASIGYLAVLAIRTWPAVNAREDGTAEEFGRLVMRTAPVDSMVFARDDRVVFTLWYFHFALRERPDIAVIVTDLLPFDWYRHNLRRTYPSLAVPVAAQEPWVSAIVRLNDARAACYTFDPLASITCQR